MHIPHCSTPSPPTTTTTALTTTKSTATATITINDYTSGAAEEISLNVRERCRNLNAKMGMIELTLLASFNQMAI